jgi:hypothetical protein
MSDVPANDADRAEPHSSDFFLVRPSSTELGLEPMALGEFHDEAVRVPFEPAFFAVSLIATRLWPIWRDGRKQIELAVEVWGEVPLVQIFRDFLDRYPSGVPFSQQQIAITQRLLVDHARDGELGVEITPDEILSLTRILVHAHDLADWPHRRLERGQASEIEVLAYLMQGGAYYERPALLNTFSRAHELFLERARADGDQLVPLDEWSLSDYKTTLEEQFAAGFGYAAVAHAFDEDAADQRVLLDPYVLANTALAEREDSVAGLLAADRKWFQAQFAKGDGSVRDLAWEVTPFLRRPFLRLSSEKLVLVSPSAINYWIGQGFYDRLRESAKTRKTKRNDTLSAYGSHYGNLVEGYALELVQSVFPPGRVQRDVPYGKGGGYRTPDIAIDLDDDVVLIEVRSGVLSPWFRTSGDIREFEEQIGRLVLDKINQLGRRVADLMQGTAVIPKVDVPAAERVWPILTTASLMQSELFYDWVQSQLPAALKTASIQPLVILDIEDLEILMGLVEANHDLIEMLESWQTGPYAKLELKRWMLGELGAPDTTRATATVAAWERATHAMEATLGWPPTS